LDKLSYWDIYIIFVFYLNIVMYIVIHEIVDVIVFDDVINCNNKYA